MEMSIVFIFCMSTFHDSVDPAQLTPEFWQCFIYHSSYVPTWALSYIMDEDPTEVAQLAKSSELKLALAPCHAEHVPSPSVPPSVPLRPYHAANQQLRFASSNLRTISLCQIRYTLWNY